MPTGVYIRTKPISAETLAKRSAALKGRVCSPETRAKIAAAHTGRKFSAERCAAMSASRKGVKLSPERRAALIAAITGRPVSAETRAKIGAANRGNVHTPEFCAAMSAARKGKSLGPCSPETRAKISAVQKGRKKSPEHCLKNSDSHKGQIVSAAHRAAISAAGKGKKRPPFSAEWKANIGRAGIGRHVTADTKAKRSASLKKAWEEGRHPVNTSLRYTSLAQKLHAQLSSRGLILEPEVRFGRFTVDLYDRVNHVAYEADGMYWHQRTEATRPGYEAARDAYLLQRHNLPVIHYTDIDIEEMLKRQAS